MIKIGPHQTTTTAQLEAVAASHTHIDLTDDARQHMLASHTLLDHLKSEHALIYGLTTGFGPLARTHLPPKHAKALQKNLVYHLASGVGDALNHAQSRAVMTARVINLSKGHAALHPDGAQQLITALNANLAPVIPSLGSVGASGDLTPLAHMTLALIGEGAWITPDGEHHEGTNALDAANIPALELNDREGLALVNGTSAMTGMAALNDMQAERLLHWSASLAVAYAEIFEGFIDAWDMRLGRVRPHPGQQWAHEQLNQRTLGSERLRQRAVVRVGETMSYEQPLLQDAYSIRCAPQALGAARDVQMFHRQVVERELNSVTDNPIFFPEDQDVVHGGNFFGQHVAFVSDALNNAIIQLMVWSERRLARLTDDAQNGALPAFLQDHQTGLHSGFMGAQVTASSLIGWVRGHAHALSIQSIPTNANNQDINTMGTLAAWRTSTTLQRAFELLSIEALALTQAMEWFNTPESWSSHTRQWHRWVRQHVSALSVDRPLSKDIQRLALQMQRYNTCSCAIESK